jgi:hypothetical protein
LSPIRRESVGTDVWDKASEEGGDGRIGQDLGKQMENQKFGTDKPHFMIRKS